MYLIKTIIDRCPIHLNNSEYLIDRIHCAYVSLIDMHFDKFDSRKFSQKVFSIFYDTLGPGIHLHYK